ncbi:MAG: 30S ribosomal protein S9 [Candidatus Yanofskybacteria bacterium]|nr:30S ribosomal protein S9 [Candidatus Yanofskybacteria bacterium]
MATKKSTTKTKAPKSKTAKEKVAKVKVEKKITAEPKKQAATKEKIIEPQAVRPAAEKYYESIGRRKRAVARVRVYTKKSTDAQVSEDKALIIVNDKPYNEYFRTSELQNTVEAPLKKLKSLNRFKATAKVFGGGTSGQAGAIKLGLSRALVLFDQNFSKKLRKSGYLTRDSREKERRKYGLKKARKAPQWAKR